MRVRQPSMEWEHRHFDGKTQEKGCTLVPLKVYFKNGKAKVDLGICKAKKLYDKRAALKKREADREIDRGMKSRNR